MKDVAYPDETHTALAARIARLTDAAGQADAPTETALPGLFLTRARRPRRFDLTCYDPVFCLVLQGQKESDVGDRRVIFAEGRSLIISHDMPAVPHVTRATPDRPYLAVGVRLRLPLLRELAAEIGAIPLGTARAEAIASGTADAELMDVVRRMVTALDSPVTLTALGPGLDRELHFRLLMADHGGMLRELAMADSQASRIARSIALLRQRYRDKLTVADLAAEAGMSASAFHDRFRSVTGATPLQFRRRLRMIEAHGLLAGGRPVTETAYTVGYESATQFSREFRSEFGCAPSDVRRRGVAA